MSLNYFLQFRKFRKKESLHKENFMNFYKKEFKAVWFSSFQNFFSIYFYRLGQVCLEYMIYTWRKKAIVGKWSGRAKVTCRGNMRIGKYWETAELHKKQRQNLFLLKNQSQSIVTESHFISSLGELGWLPFLPLLPNDPNNSSGSLGVQNSNQSKLCTDGFWGSDLALCYA